MTRKLKWLKITVSEYVQFLFILWACVSNIYQIVFTYQRVGFFDALSYWKKLNFFFLIFNL